MKSRPKILNGTVRRKIYDHPKFSTVQPPTNGPTAVIIPDDVAQSPIAFPLSSIGKFVTRIERLPGIISAAPVP